MRFFCGKIPPEGAEMYGVFVSAFFSGLLTEPDPARWVIFNLSFLVQVDFAAGVKNLRLFAPSSTGLHGGVRDKEGSEHQSCCKLHQI